MVAKNSAAIGADQCCNGYRRLAIRTGPRNVTGSDVLTRVAGNRPRRLCCQRHEGQDRAKRSGNTKDKTQKHCYTNWIGVTKQTSRGESHSNSQQHCSNQAELAG